ncbi:hypothetical protein BN1723_012582 [Verticillium longisporum]|uniref:Copper transport protein n=1 Tax=Verticillium longisporum TaxID=100787 RepID=A0A0G4LJD6_VERLO|nr:hypothetical protein BN1708_011221 [Verticillium longisporum]CRK22128.1 hypothetical protein BN1723_012582 [Verticillium longisporum]
MFSTGAGTPLYSSGWSPISNDDYAGTCFFLLALGALARCLVAVKAVLERRWIDADLNSRYIVVKTNPEKYIGSNPQSGNSVLSENGVEKDIIIVRRHRNGARPWRITVDGPAAAIDTLIAGYAIHHADECGLFPLCPRWDIPW